MTDLESIKKTLTRVSKGNGILDMLIEFERTLDNAEIFAYKNWILGEVVDGPTIERYWFSVVLMYPYKKMPDPIAGLRLTKLGAKVNYRKGIFKKPTKIQGPEDWADPVTKKAVIEEHKVWLVTIQLPIKYINRGIDNAAEIIQHDLQSANEQLADDYESTDQSPGLDQDSDQLDIGDEMGMADEEEIKA